MTKLKIKYLLQNKGKLHQMIKTAHDTNFLHIANMSKSVISDSYQTIIIGAFGGLS